MSGPLRFEWLCLTCGRTGAIQHDGAAYTSLMCRCAFDHAETNPKCRAIDDSVVWPVPGGLFMQARKDVDRRRVPNGR